MNKCGLDRYQAAVARCLADGLTYRDTAIAVYKCVGKDGLTDEALVKKSMEKISNLVHTKQFKECYKSIMADYHLPRIGTAFKVLEKQMGSENEWVANKASNDILTRCTPAVFGDDEKQIVVRVEGMPELGVPEADDAEE